MTYEVEFTVTPPVDATEDQVQEWLEFCLGANAEISKSNPLSDYDMSADSFSVLIK